MAAAVSERLGEHVIATKIYTGTSRILLRDAEAIAEIALGIICSATSHPDRIGFTAGFSAGHNSSCFAGMGCILWGVNQRMGIALSLAVVLSAGKRAGASRQGPVGH